MFGEARFMKVEGLGGLCEFFLLLIVGGLLNTSYTYDHIFVKLKMVNTVSLSSFRVEKFIKRKHLKILSQIM